ncbi:paraquat-inducible protein A [Roseibium hamelinense]|nr:paraquat-inducible protein A [Roseibium hamelinense]
MTNKVRSSERTLAAMIGALILYGVAVSFPFLSMERSGLENKISVIDCISVLWTNQMYLLSIALALLIVVLPVSRILLLVQVVGTIRVNGRAGWRNARALRWAQFLEPWSMAEIFMIGVIVSLVKVGKMANITVGPSFIALTVLIVLLTWTSTAMCRSTTWAALERKQ